MNKSSEKLSFWNVSVVNKKTRFLQEIWFFTVSKNLDALKIASTFTPFED